MSAIDIMPTPPRRLSPTGWTDAEALIEGMKAAGMVPSLWTCRGCGNTLRVWTEPHSGSYVPQCCGEMEVWDGKERPKRSPCVRPCKEPDPL